MKFLPRRITDLFSTDVLFREPWMTTRRFVRFCLLFKIALSSQHDRTDFDAKYIKRRSLRRNALFLDQKKQNVTFRYFPSHQICHFGPAFDGTENSPRKPLYPPLIHIVAP